VPPSSPTHSPPPPQRPLPDAPELVRPRVSAPDSFEQNPLSHVTELLSLKAAEGLDDAGRVREALRIVISEGVSIAEAARRCHVTPSCLFEWREKYLDLLNEEPSIASQPLMEQGATIKDADLIRIPRAAREHFTENWERLMEVTRAESSAFRQHPILLFLENSALTRWFYHDGKLDRGVLAGVLVVLSVLVLTATFLSAGHFYRKDETKPQMVENYDAVIRRAADAARKFFSAPTVEEKMKYVRMDDEVRPLMEEHFRRHPAASVPRADLTKAIPGDDRYALEFDIPSLDRKHFCVVVEKNGEMLVDWETCSFFQEANFERIRQTKPQTPVRVAARVVEDSYYNYGFTSGKFTCFRLYYPGLELDLFAYAAKDSIEEGTLNLLVKPVAASDRQLTAILEVRYPPGDVPANQVEIVRIVSRDWIAP
jgi:hypothetical protein